MLRPCETRWLSVGSAIERVLRHWDSLRQYFADINCDNDVYVVKELSQMFNDPKNKVLLTFVHKHISELQSLNKTFQATYIDAPKLADELLAYYFGILSVIVTPNGVRLAKSSSSPLEFDFDPFLREHSTVHLGYKFQRDAPIVFSTSELPAITSQLIDFITEIVRQIRKRLPDNLTVLRKANALEPSRVIGAPSFSDDVSLLAIFYERLEGVEVAVVEAEWRRLVNIDLKSTNETPLEDFWAEVTNIRSLEDHQSYPGLSKIASAVLCLPTSNASVERVFSVMATVKTKQRNRMFIRTLAAVIAVRAGMRRNGQDCSTFKPLPRMFEKMNANMYLPESAAAPVDHDDHEDNDIVEVVRDVEALLGKEVEIV